MLQVTNFQKIFDVLPSLSYMNNLALQNCWAICNIFTFKHEISSSYFIQVFSNILYTNQSLICDNNLHFLHNVYIFLNTNTGQILPSCLRKFLECINYSK